MQPQDPTAQPNESQQRLLGQRQAILARLGDCYLSLEVHKSRADQCTQMIQQLRAALTELDQTIRNLPEQELEAQEPVGV